MSCTLSPIVLLFHGDLSFGFFSIMSSFWSFQSSDSLGTVVAGMWWQSLQNWHLSRLGSADDLLLSVRGLVDGVLPMLDQNRHHWSDSTAVQGLHWMVASQWPNTDGSLWICWFLGNYRTSLGVAVRGEMRISGMGLVALARHKTQGCTANRSLICSTLQSKSLVDAMTAENSLHCFRALV